MTHLKFARLAYYLQPKKVGIEKNIVFKLPIGTCKNFEIYTYAEFPKFPRRSSSQTCGARGPPVPFRNTGTAAW